MSARCHAPGLLAALAKAGALCALALSAAPDAARAHGSAPAARHDSAPCFLRRDWSGGWRATADARTIYISVPPWIYRLDLDQSYPLLRSPWAVLENLGGNMSICTPLDFRLSVTNQLGVWEAPIVRGLFRLTPAEAAELPKRLRP
ncbi:MAG TPA: hypothetical protein VMU67_02550 [Steroidobacteraceae bacterium]|nr:hypothetical protein [Steroidobacteraceae bacterium]